jgi:hypothetical protein
VLDKFAQWCNSWRPLAPLLWALLAIHAARGDVGLPEYEEPQLDIPLYISGDRAALGSGQAVNAIKAIRTGESLVLVSEDKEYFAQLQNIHPRDKLLVQTPQALRHYQVTRTLVIHARITPAGLETYDQAPEETLTLAACYPFQPLAPRRFQNLQPAGKDALLYVVHAQPIPAALPYRLNF